MNTIIKNEAYKQLKIIYDKHIEDAMYEARDLLASQLDIEHDDLVWMIENNEILPQLAEKIDQLYDSEIEEPKKNRQRMMLEF